MCRFGRREVTLTGMSLISWLTFLVLGLLSMLGVTFFPFLTMKMVFPLVRCYIFALGTGVYLSLTSVFCFVFTLCCFNYLLSFLLNLGSSCCFVLYALFFSCFLSKLCLWMSAMRAACPKIGCCSGSRCG